MKYPNEAKVYAVHILHSNNLQTVMSDRFTTLVKKYNAALTWDSKDPTKYLASLVLLTQEQQEAFYHAVVALGIRAELDTGPAYVSSKYAQEMRSRT